MRADREDIRLRAGRRRYFQAGPTILTSVTFEDLRRFVGGMAKLFPRRRKEQKQRKYRKLLRE